MNITEARRDTLFIYRGQYVLSFAVICLWILFCLYGDYDGIFVDGIFPDGLRIGVPSLWLLLSHY